MKDRQQVLNLIVGIAGLVSVIVGLFGIGGISAFWRIIHIGLGVVMAWSELPSLVALYQSIFKK